MAAVIDSLNALHRREFAQAQRPVAPHKSMPLITGLQASLRSYALKGVGLFKRAERAQAKAWADGEAAAEHNRRLADAAAEQARHQVVLDSWWSNLVTNDPFTVISALADAFEDNQAPAAPIGVAGDDVSMVVLVPSPDVLPERIPSVTDAGNLSLRKVTKAQTAALYLTLVSGLALVTVKEALAVAPGIQSATVVVVRHARDDSYGAVRVECILAARIRRASLSHIRWQSSNAPSVLIDASDERLVRTKGQAKELVPLDVSNEPEIAAVLAAVDVERLVQSHPSRY